MGKSNIEKNKLIDLHSHTNASDGDLTPEELLIRAQKNGVTMLAITDHDTVSGYVSVCDEKVATSLSLKLISGVEISTVWNGVGIHLVGLNFDVAHPKMVALLEQQSVARQQRANIILEKLSKANMPISLSEVEGIANHSHIGRPHIAQAMVAKGYVNNINSAFKKYLGAGKIGDIKSGWTSIPTAVQTIVDSGGIAVLAHPNKYKITRTKLMMLLDDFQESGGQAIEVISGRQHRSITEKYAHIARERGFYASCGSDFHRPLSYVADIGELATMPEDLTPVWEKFS